jgi:hypothetical protein
MLISPAAIACAYLLQSTPPPRTLFTDLTSHYLPVITPLQPAT